MGEPTLLDRLAYQFKLIPEAVWATVILSMSSGVALMVSKAGGSDDWAACAALVATMVIRLAIGYLVGTYDFQHIAELLWAGVAAAAGIVTAAITAAVQGEVTVTSAWAAGIAMSFSRMAVSSVLAAITPSGGFQLNDGGGNG